jgi:hypothetical protein
MSDYHDTAVAALELVKFVANKHGIESLDGFTCPYMRALAATFCRDAWAVKYNNEYEELRKEHEHDEQACPKTYFFEAVESSNPNATGVEIYLCQKWEFGTPRACFTEIQNDFSYFRMPWPKVINEADDLAYFEDGVIYLYDNEEYDYKAPSLAKVRKGMKEGGFEEKKGVAEAYKRAHEKISKEKRYGFE